VKILLKSKGKTHLLKYFFGLINPLCTHEFLFINTSCGAFNESIINEFWKPWQKIIIFIKVLFELNFKKIYELFTLGFDV
jgi:hypothetical protein